MTLASNEYVVTAWAESARGPGWGNQPLWVLVGVQGGGPYRVDCIQPDEQTAEMSCLYAVSQSAHLAMTAAVRRKLEGNRDSNSQRCR